MDAIDRTDSSGGAQRALPEKLLEVRALSKSFGGARALDHVSLSFRAGEVHGVLGENGSGKSTLIKILAGFHAPDAGELLVGGRSVALPLAPGQFRALGMGFVHQDLGLVGSLSVTENMALGRFHSRAAINWPAEWRRLRESFDRYGLQLDPRAAVDSLSPVEQAQLAIVRALEQLREGGAQRPILFLDEPTVFLPRRETEGLFALIRGVADRGGAVVFVSHDLEEVLEVTDRVSVLRDGQVVGELETAQASAERLIELIVGHPLEQAQTTTVALAGGAVAPSDTVRIDGLNGAGVHDLELALAPGEIVGLTGLAGSGFERVPYLLFGSQRAQSGSLQLAGRRVELPSLSPSQAVAAGVALIPANRQRDGAALALSVDDNVTIGRLGSFVSGALLRRGRMRVDTKRLLEQFAVRPPEPGAAFGALSGGNQQKALVAKWLALGPRLLLLDEPTQGVDVGARKQIFHYIRQIARQGAAVLVSSSDHEQLAEICDRVLIFVEGRAARELGGAELTKQQITQQCLGSARAPQASSLSSASQEVRSR